MKVSEKIKRKIYRIKEGTTFKYQQIGIAPEEYSAAAKAIERLIETKAIKRVSTGVFYKPKKTVFGEVRPEEKELLKPYLFRQNKRIAYITGTSLYNLMGLTTQIPRVIKVASRDNRISIRLGTIQAKPVKSYVDVDDKNYVFLEILDALKDFKDIPDLEKSAAIKNIIGKIIELDSLQKNQLVKYSLKYPPRTRALLGALLETLGLQDNESLLKILMSTLNPLTCYYFGIDKQILTTVSRWNIK